MYSNIQDYMICYKDKCKTEYDNINKDLKLKNLKNKLKKIKN